MFEHSQIMETEILPRRAMALAISACLHIVAIAVVVVLPMVFLEILPERDLLTFLIEPPPPPTPPTA